MIEAVLGVAAAATFLSLLAIGLSIWAIAEVLGWKRSTHQVQLVPAEELVKKSPEGQPENPFQHIDDFMG